MRRISVLGFRRLRWRSLAMALAIVPVIALGGAAQGEDAQGVETLPAGRVADLQARGVTLIDIRRDDEWRQTGTVPGSLRITAFDAGGQLDPGFLAAVAARAPKDRPLALICRSGNRSAKAARLLVEQDGYAHVYDLAGGVAALITAGYPLEPCPGC